MLARKKNPDEEEPLIPHGLIWQATEQPVPPAGSPAARPEVPKETGKTVVMPPRIESLGITSSSEDPRPEKHAARMGAISPPLPWPSPKIQEIAKGARSRIPPEVTSALAIPAAPKLADKPELPVVPIAREPVLDRVLPRVKLVSRIRAQCGTAAETLSRRCRGGVALLTGWFVALQRLGATARNFYRVSAIRRRFRWDIVSRLTKSRRAAGQVMVRVRTGLERIDTAAHRALDFKVRIRIHVPMISAIKRRLTREAGHRHSGLPSVQRDSRLWVSMAMAALSALLALGVITAVRPYTPGSAPSRASANAPATPAARPGAVPLSERTSGIIRASAQVPTTSAVTSALLSTSARTSLKAEAVRKKVHHNRDEGYVAKNTYVYYGLNGKPSH